MSAHILPASAQADQSVSDVIMNKFQDHANRLGYLNELSSDTSSNLFTRIGSVAVLGVVTVAALAIGTTVAPGALALAAITGGVALYRGKQALDENRFLREVKQEAHDISTEAKALREVALVAEKSDLTNREKLAGAFNVISKQYERIEELSQQPFNRILSTFAPKKTA